VLAAAEAVRKGLRIFVAPIIATTILSVLLQDALPPGRALAYSLFPYDDEVVGISLWGGIIPILASLLILETGTWDKRDPRPFRSWRYWLVVLATALVATIVFSVSHELIGGLELSKPAAIVAIEVGAATGIGYWWFRGQRLPLVQGIAECYVMGTLGIFGSDVIRTLSLLATTPGAATVWGGGGLHDLVLWFGLYVSISFTCVRVLIPPRATARRT
jgi:hypothetical protein